MKATEPFNNVLAVFDSLPLIKSEQTPLRDVMPGVWPVVSDLRALMRSHSELAGLANEFRSYLELKLIGFRQEYPEDHCIVQTAVRYIDQINAALRGHCPLHAQPQRGCIDCGTA